MLNIGTKYNILEEVIEFATPEIINNLTYQSISCFLFLFLNPNDIKYILCL